MTLDPINGNTILPMQAQGTFSQPTICPLEGNGQGEQVELGSASALQKPSFPCSRL